jgi:hypothetical protein
MGTGYLLLASLTKSQHSGPHLVKRDAGPLDGEGVDLEAPELGLQADGLLEQLLLLLRPGQQLRRPTAVTGVVVVMALLCQTGGPPRVKRT